MPDDPTQLDPNSFCAGYESGVRAAQDEQPYLHDNTAFADELRARLASKVPQVVIHEKLRRPIDPQDARRDWIHAFRDSVALRHGVKVERPHPLAGELRDMPFSKLARAVGVGLTTSDFSQLLVAGYSTTLPSFNDKNPADLLVRDQPVKDYKLFTAGTIDFEAPEQIYEETIPEFRQTRHQAATGALLEFAITIRLSRQLLIADDAHSRGIADQMIRQAVQLLARQDLILIASVLEANANLGDGNPLFGTANSVDITSPTVEKFADAVAKLATQASALGNLACATPALLMTSADDAVQWAVVLATLINVLPIRLVTNPYLASGSAYLMADPQQTTSLVRLRFPGVTAPRLWPMKYLPGPDGQRLTYNGTLISARYETNILAVSRLGIVRLVTGD